MLAYPLNFSSRYNRVIDLIKNNLESTVTRPFFGSVNYGVSNHLDVS